MTYVVYDCGVYRSADVCMHAVQGLLSFLSAPLIGALSDIWGRKPFLLLTVTFTCVPIPLMKFSPWSVADMCWLQLVCYLDDNYDGETVNPIQTESALLSRVFCRPEFFVVVCCSSALELLRSRLAATC